MRIGHGYDAHRFAAGRRLIIGGAGIPYASGLDGHSDADVLTHAVMDALLGAACMRDIGTIFPDTDPAYKNADSIKLLGKVCGIVQAAGFSICNIDATVIAQKPKLRPYVTKMRENLASACKIEIGRVNVKATTEEGMGFTGALEGICAHAVCLLE